MTGFRKIVWAVTVLSCMAGAKAQGMGGSSSLQRVVEVESPKMRVFLPDADKATGRAVVALPGGAYAMLATGHEGYDWAGFFNDRGIAFAVVEYRLPHGDRSLSIGDAEAAMRIVRDSAEVWHINPGDVGIMGSSAGGHLASTVATHAEGNARPDFQILFYPVITMDKSYTHMGSHDNLLGKDASESLENEFSNEKQVSSTTPRAFIVFSDDDNVVPPMNGVNYYSALHRAGVPATFHIYPSGGHGWGCLPRFKYHDEMVADLSAWLKSF